MLAPPRAVEQQAAVREPGQGVVRDRVAQPRGRARPAHRVGEHVADVPHEGGLGSVEAAGRARRRDEDREGGGGAARRDRQPGDDALRAHPRQAGQRVVGRRGVEGQRVPGGQRRAREGAVDGEAGAAGRRHRPADGATEGEAPLPRHDLEHGRELGPEAGGQHAGGALEQLGRGHAGQRALAQRRELLLAAGPPLQRIRRVQARGGVDEHGLGAGPVGRVTGVHADVDAERRPIGAQRVTQAARAEALGEEAVERAAEQRPGSDAQQRVGGGVGGPDATVGVHGEHRHRKLVERRGRRGRRVGAALEREHERGVATAPADGGLDADRHGRGAPRVAVAGPHEVEVERAGAAAAAQRVQEPVGALAPLRGDETGEGRALHLAGGDAYERRRRAVGAAHDERVVELHEGGGQRVELVTLEAVLPGPGESGHGRGNARAARDLRQPGARFAARREDLRAGLAARPGRPAAGPGDRAAGRPDGPLAARQRARAPRPPPARDRGTARPPGRRPAPPRRWSRGRRRTGTRSAGSAEPVAASGGRSRGRACAGRRRPSRRRARRARRRRSIERQRGSHSRTLFVSSAMR